MLYSCRETVKLVSTHHHLPQKKGWSIPLIHCSFCSILLSLLLTGTGRMTSGLPARSAICWYKGTPFSPAPALHTARDTPRMALAPNWAKTWMDRTHKLLDKWIILNKWIVAHPKKKKTVHFSVQTNFCRTHPFRKINAIAIPLFPLRS